MRTKREKAQQINIGSLEEDALLKVLSKLQVKSLLRFKCVSKCWNELISDPYFVKLHLNQSIQDENFGVIMNAACEFKNRFFHYSVNHLDEEPDASTAEGTSRPQATKWMHFKYNLLKPCDYHHHNYQTRSRTKRKDGDTISYNTAHGSCNGLVLVTSYDFRIALFNPSTGEFKELPAVIYALADDDTLLTRLGLGYDSTNDDYKVVAVSAASDDDSSSSSSSSNTDETPQYRTSVYSLRSNRWRLLSKRIPPGILDDDFENYNYITTGKYLNGAIHWLKVISDDEDDEEDTIDVRISYFEVESEEWKQFEAPRPNREIDEYEYQDLRLFVRSGRLCVVYHYYSDSAGHSGEIYEMREYGVKESWCKVSTISLRVMFGKCPAKRVMICALNKGKWLLQRRCGRQVTMILYDPKNCSFEEIKIATALTEYHGYTYQGFDFCKSLNVTGFDTYVSSLVTIVLN